jgi:hypothetical protein
LPRAHLTRDLEPSREGDVALVVVAVGENVSVFFSRGVRGSRWKSTKKKQLFSFLSPSFLSSSSPAPLLRPFHLQPLPAHALDRRGDVLG